MDTSHISLFCRFRLANCARPGALSNSWNILKVCLQDGSYIEMLPHIECYMVSTEPDVEVCGAVGAAQTTYRIALIPRRKPFPHIVIHVPDSSFDIATLLWPGQVIADVRFLLL